MLDPESRYYRFGWWFGVVMLALCLLLIPAMVYYSQWLNLAASVLLVVALTFFYLRPVGPDDDPSDPKSPRNVRGYYFSWLVFIAAILMTLQVIMLDI